MDINELKIGLILFELKNGDKYGVELMSNISNKTQTAIDIKQTQLYTILKNLSNAKLIDSYWKDSDIGGKRHYYKLTKLGEKKLSTLPAEEQLISQAIALKYSNFKSANKKSAAPAKDVKQATKLDNTTVLEQNIKNVDLVNNSEIHDKSNEAFIKNTKVNIIKSQVDKSVFIKTKANKADNASKDNLLNSDETKKPTKYNVKRQDYIDYSTNKTMVGRKKLYYKLWIKASVFFALQLLVISLCFALTRNIINTLIFDIFLCVDLLSSLAFYYYFMVKAQETKYQVLDNKFCISLKKELIICSVISGSVFLTMLIIFLIANTVYPASVNLILLIPVAIIALLPLVYWAMDIFICKDKFYPTKLKK